VPKLAGKLSAVRFQLIPVEENGAVVLRYRAARFIDAIYQRFAEEFAGLIQCARLRSLVPQKRWPWRSPLLFPPLQNESFAGWVSNSD